MKDYSRKVTENYSKDIYYASTKGLVDADDVLMLSREFAQWAPSLIAMAKKKNVQEASIGILNRNDLIQMTSICFLEAWMKLFEPLDSHHKKTVNWDVINNNFEPQKALWGHLKKTVEIRLGDRIREFKDGVKVPHYELWYESQKKNGVGGAMFDAMTGLFPQLKLELELSYKVEEETSWNNYRLVEKLQAHFREFIKNDKYIFVLERSMGIDGDKMSSKEISEKLGTSTNNVDKIRSRAIKKLKSDESKRKLAFVLDGALIETGANIAEFLK